MIVDEAVSADAVLKCIALFMSDSLGAVQTFSNLEAVCKGPIGSVTVANTRNLVIDCDAYNDADT